MRSCVEAKMIPSGLEVLYSGEFVTRLLSMTSSGSIIWFAYLILPPIIRPNIVRNSGLDFLRKIKKLPRERELAFYLLNGNAMVD